MSGRGQGQSNDDNKSAQCNPDNEHQGHVLCYAGTGTKADLDNHSNQMNPNNPKYKGPKTKRT